MVLNQPRHRVGSESVHSTPLFKSSVYWVGKGSILRQILAAGEELHASRFTSEPSLSPEEWRCVIHVLSFVLHRNRSLSHLFPRRIHLSSDRSPQGEILPSRDLFCCTAWPWMSGLKHVYVLSNLLRGKKRTLNRLSLTKRKRRTKDF